MKSGGRVCLYSCVGAKMGATQGKQEMKEKNRKQAGKASSRKALELQKPGRHMALEPS